MSARVMETLQTMTPNIEVYSIDEAFTEISGKTGKDILDTANMIRNRVLQWTGIPVSVGIAPTKTLAKIANDTAKTDHTLKGVRFMNDRDTIMNLLKKVPVSEIWGIGRNYTSFLENQGIYTAFDLSNMPDGWVRNHMKVPGSERCGNCADIHVLPWNRQQTQKRGYLVLVHLENL